MHKGRRRGVEFLDAFYPVLLRTLPKMLAAANPAVRQELVRIVQIWIEVKHFGNTGTKALQDILTAGGLNGQSAGAEARGGTAAPAPAPAPASVPAPRDPREPRGDAWDDTLAVVAERTAEARKASGHARQRCGFAASESEHGCVVRLGGSTRVCPAWPPRLLRAEGADAARLRPELEEAAAASAAEVAAWESLGEVVRELAQMQSQALARVRLVAWCGRRRMFPLLYGIVAEPLPAA